MEFLLKYAIFDGFEVTVTQPLGLGVRTRSHSIDLINTYCSVLFHEKIFINIFFIAKKPLRDTSINQMAAISL